MLEFVWWGLASPHQNTVRRLGVLPCPTPGIPSGGNRRLRQGDPQTPACADRSRNRRVRRALRSLPREIKHAALAPETNAARTRAERTRRSSGEVVWADVNPFYVPATQSTPAFCAAVVADITDRKRAGAALRAS